MALDKQQLKGDIKELVEDMLQREETSIEEFSTRLSNVIDTYVKSATIVYTSGLTAPNGPVIGVFNGNLE